MVGPARPQFVLFGSSLIQYCFKEEGWGAILAEIYSRKADIIVRGYSGWNSRRAVKVLDQVFPKDAAVQPSLVIVYFGGNDAILPYPGGFGPHVPLPEYVENMRKIGLHLKSLSEKTRVIFLTAPPVNEDMIVECDKTHENCRLYSEACLEICRELELKGVDLWTAIQQRPDWKTTCFLDGTHFTKEGSKMVAKEILKALREAEWEPSLHWKALPTEFDEDSPYYPVRPDDLENMLLGQSDKQQTSEDST